MQHRDGDFVHLRVSAFECCQICNRSVGNILESLIGEVGLVRGHDDIGKCDQSLEHVILDDAFRKIFIEEIGFLFVHVEAEIADVLGL
jgi:calcineurin-like phosphoesterase family protein